MYLVTGGVSSTGHNIISTEVMSSLGSSWTYVGNLPNAAYGLSGISVNNQIFITGGYGDGGYLSAILKFNPASNEWEKTGELSIARCYQAVAVLPLKDVKPYC